MNFDYTIYKNRKFLDELEAYLQSDPVKKADELESEILKLRVNHQKELGRLRQKIREQASKIARLGLEVGRGML